MMYPCSRLTVTDVAAERCQSRFARCRQSCLQGCADRWTKHRLPRGHVRRCASKCRHMEAYVCLAASNEPPFPRNALARRCNAGPFDVADKFFKEANAPLDARIRHYFVDSSLTPLLVQVRLPP
eukprot:scaffold83181_cov25-Tisochrysis_lutea.AAC.5